MDNNDDLGFTPDQPAAEPVQQSPQQSPSQPQAVSEGTDLGFVPDAKPVPEQSGWVRQDPYANDSKSMGFQMDDQEAAQEEKYTSPLQKTAAAAEGAGEGMAGFLAPAAERLAGVPAEDIENRAKYNKYTRGAAEAAALIGSSVYGVGLAKGMAVAGEGVTKAIGLAEPAGYIARVGSLAVEQATEMAVLQSSNEISRKILNEPTSVESALANVGTASALGFGTGAFIAGAASPLWKASGGEKKLQEFLYATKSHLNSNASLDAAPAEALPGTTEEASPNNTLDLVHLSPQKLKVIDPKFAGTGVDRGVRGRDLEEKISHYYIKGAPRSPGDSMVQGNEHLVSVDLDKDPVYDYGKDPDGIIKAAKEANGGAWNLDIASRMLKDKGYSGFMNSKNPDNFNTVMMFKPMPVKAINGEPVSDTMGKILGHIGGNESRVADRLPSDFSILSAQVGDKANPAGHAALKKILQDQGFQVDEVAGHYGHTPEPAFMVRTNGSPEAQAKLDELGKEFNQESVIHSNAANGIRQNELRFMDGRPSLTGSGVNQNPYAKTDYSLHPQFGKFQLGIGSGAPVTDSTVRQLAQKALRPVKGRALMEAARDEAADRTVEAVMGDEEGDSPLNTALDTLGVKVAPAMRAAMSGDPKAIQIFNELREAQHPEILAHLKDLPEQVQRSVLGQIKTPVEDLAHYSENESGRDLYQSFSNEYNKHYAPIAKAMEERNLRAADINVPDEARRDFGGNIIETGMKAVGTDSPYYKTYEHYAQRVMAKDTIGGLDQLKTEIYNKAKSMSTDLNEKQALNSVRNMISTFQENQIERQGVMIGKDGLMLSPEVIAQRAAANREYAKFADMSGELTDHLGVGNFRGAGTLKDKLEGLAPEDLLKKFSPKGNADAIPFLQKYFPETLSKLQEVETKKFMKPAVFQNQGETSIDIPRLGKMLQNLKKGAPEYADFVMPAEVQQRLEAAQTVLQHVPGIKSSGTAGWISKLTKHMPASAVATVGFMMGHNPVSSYILGELAARLGKDVPEAMKLSYLKYLGSPKSISAPGFKSMVDTIEQTIKGETKIAKATGAVFKVGAAAIADTPSLSDRAKLDKIVSGYQNDPRRVDNIAQNSQLGHYMPEHQAVMSNAVSSQVKYLSTLKPKPYRASPLDRPIDPSSQQMDRYNRALDIANDPTTVMQHVKDGTLQISDIQDLQSLYPSLYPKMQQQLLKELSQSHVDEDHVPYTTRMGLSLFLQTPIDSSMSPESILAAQPKPQGGQQPQAAMQGRKGKTAIDKMPSSYKTPLQAAEGDRSTRD